MKILSVVGHATAPFFPFELHAAFGVLGLMLQRVLTYPARRQGRGAG